MLLTKSELSRFIRLRTKKQAFRAPDVLDYSGNDTPHFSEKPGLEF